MDTSYKVTGVSKFKGEYKVRWANDLTRVKLLAKSGNTDIDLIELPEELSKAECVTYLKTTDMYKVPEKAAAIDAADAKYNSGPVTVKAKKAVKPAEAKNNKTTKSDKKPSLASIKSRISKKETKESISTEGATEPVQA